MKNNIKFYQIGVLLSCLSLIFACKTYTGPEPVFEEYAPDVKSSAGRHVLMIVIDGAVGSIVKEVKPATIESLLPTSKYTFQGISEAVSTDVTAWASMMTGTTYSTHKVANDGFRPKGSLDDPHSVGGYYPSAFYRLLENRPDFETVAVTSWPALANNFLAEATYVELQEDDEKVKDKALEYLKDKDPKFTVVNFRNVLKTGLNSGFSKDNAEYVNAIHAVDGHVKALVDQVKARPTYDEETWLIIITSSQGGEGKTIGGSTPGARNTFTLFHNKHFKPLELIPDFTYINAVRFFGWDGTNGTTLGVRAQAQDPEGNYNPKRGSMTIQTRIKFNKNSAGSYNYFVPPFLSKTQNRSGSTIGWSLIRNSNQIEMYLADGVNTLYVAVPNVGTDGAWHTLTATINVTGTQYVAKLYIDGQLAAEKSMAGTASIESAAPLVMGYWPTVFSSEYVDMYMGDLRIWNKELAAEAISLNACYSEVLSSQPDYTNLVGYWPANDGGETFVNKVANKPNFQLSGPYQYNLSTMKLTCETSKANVLVQNIDIIPQVYYWLRVDPQLSWALESTAFLNTFEVEFIK